MAADSTSGGKAVTPDTDDGRTARLARDADGEALGTAVFLDADDLRALLGTDPDEFDAARVSYAVENGHLVLNADGEDGR